MLDPRLEPVNLLRSQRWLSFGGHELLVICRERDAHDEKALVRLSGHNYSAVLSSLHQRIIGVQAQTALDFTFPMTRHAVCLENRVDVPYVKGAG